MEKKSWILPFLKKGDLRITKNYRGITLSSIVAKIYYALLLNHIEPEIKKNLKKNHNPSNSRRSSCKNLEATLWFVDFSKTFDSRHRGKMEQILLAYGHLKVTVAILMMFYHTKVKVRSLDGGTNFFDIVTGVLQEDTLAL